MVNTLRGEGSFTFHDVTFTLVATNDVLEQLSVAAGYPNQFQLAQRLAGGEPFTCRAALRLFVTKAVRKDGQPLNRTKAIGDALAEMTSLELIAIIKESLWPVVEILIGTARNPADEKAAADAAGN